MSSKDYSQYSLAQLHTAASRAATRIPYVDAQDRQYSRYGGEPEGYSEAVQEHEQLKKEIKKREEIENEKAKQREAAENEKAKQREAAENIRLANRDGLEKLQDGVDLAISTVARTAQSARGAAAIMARKASTMARKVGKARVSIPMTTQYAKQTVKQNWVVIAVIVGVVVSIMCAVMLYGLSIQQSSPCGDSGMLSLAFVALMFIGLLLMLGYSLHRGREVSADVRRDALAASRSRHRSFIRAQTDISAPENLANRLAQSFSAKNNTASAQPPQQFEMQEM